MRTDAKLFLGWFGPRGLASIVFLVIVAQDKLPGGDIIIATVVATVVLSILGRAARRRRAAAAELQPCPASDRRCVTTRWETAT